MASPRDIRRTDGSTAFKILWRKPDGTQTSKTFDDPNVRDLVLELMNANGDNYALVDQAVAAAQRKSPTVEQALAAHIDGITGVEPGTVHRYRQLAKNHITPVLGMYPVDALTRGNVTEWFGRLELAAKTKKNIHALLSAALAQAVQAGQVPENVAKGVRDSKSAQRVRTRQNVFLSREEFEHVVDTVDARYALFLRVLAGTGLRFSEATALRKRDVKLTDDRYTAAVTRAWKKTDQGYVIGGPKTVKGHRSVALPKALTPALTEHLSGLRANDLIFTLPDGGRLANNRFHENYWDEPIDKLAATTLLHDAPTIHDLRHTHASWLLNAGVPITVVSRRLGHESIKTTVDTYGHLLNDADSSAADAIG